MNSSVVRAVADRSRAALRLTVEAVAKLVAENAQLRKEVAERDEMIATLQEMLNRAHT